ncbi:MAG: hypothetical protein KH135_04170 [Firmicutes bacterium]|nr:hypothetical protein [Bacillota bacterium]
MEKYEEKELLFRYCFGENYQENTNIAIGNRICTPREIKKFRNQLLEPQNSQQKEYIQYKNLCNEFQSLQILFAYRNDYAKTLLLLDNDSHIRDLLSCFHLYLKKFQHNIYITQDEDYKWMNQILEKEIPEKSLQLFIQYISEGNMFVSLELFCKLHQISLAHFRGYIQTLKTKHPELYEKYQRIENDKNQKLEAWLEETIKILKDYRMEHETVDIIDYYKLLSAPHQLVYQSCGICRKVEYFPLLNDYGITTKKDTTGTPEEWASTVVEIGDETFTPERQLEILNEYVSMGYQNCPEVLIAAIRRKARMNQKQKHL